MKDEELIDWANSHSQSENNTHVPSENDRTILQSEIGITYAQSFHPILGTLKVCDCIAIAAWSSETKQAMLCHIDRHTIISSLGQYLDEISSEGVKLQVHLRGGTTQDLSKKKSAELIEMLRERDDVEIKSSDICTADGILPEDHGLDLTKLQKIGSYYLYRDYKCAASPYSCAIDARTGEIFTFFEEYHKNPERMRKGYNIVTRTYDQDSQGNLTTPIGFAFDGRLIPKTKKSVTERRTAKELEEYLKDFTDGSSKLKVSLKGGNKLSRQKCLAMRNVMQEEDIQVVCDVRLDNEDGEIKEFAVDARDGGIFIDRSGIKSEKKDNFIMVQIQKTSERSVGAGQGFVKFLAGMINDKELLKSRQLGG